MYREALVEQPVDPANELVALCDDNAVAPGALSATRIPERNGRPVGLYDAGDFERMVAEQRPDVVIVTTPDYLHDVYVVRALRAGLRRDHREADDDRPRAG